jgi:hypothetical protein
MAGLDLEEVLLRRVDLPIGFDDEYWDWLGQPDHLHPIVARRNPLGSPGLRDLVQPDP